MIRVGCRKANNGILEDSVLSTSWIARRYEALVLVSGQVKISWNENGAVKVVPFASPPGEFSSLSEAELGGLQFGKEWIDDEKPVIPK